MIVINNRLFIFINFYCVCFIFTRETKQSLPPFGLSQQRERIVHKEASLQVYTNGNTCIYILILLYMVLM